MSALDISINEQGIARLVLNNPEKHNAFDAVLINDLDQAIQDCQSDKKVKLLILSAQGPHFSSGADLNWMASMAQFDHDTNLQDARKLEHLMRTLYHCEKPTLAQVQGRVFGGGIGLVACCQIVIADAQAQFCFSEVKLGLIPAVISPYVIQAIGLRRARACFLTAEVFSAAQALAWGLCHEIVESNTLADRINHVAQQLLHNSPLALQAVNKLCHTLAPLPDQIGELTSKIIADLRVSPEGQEGIQAFLNKRTPNWVYS